jgi:acyl carrier protein
MPPLIERRDNMVITRRNLVERVLEVLREFTGKENITLESRLEEDLELDSLDQVELLMRLEEASGLQITDETAQQWKTARDVVAYLASRLGVGE